MTPAEVLAASARLKDAISRDDGEEAGMAALVDLLTGVALNLAILAHRTGDPE